jgi:hypothetical protein
MDTHKITIPHIFMYEDANDIHEVYRWCVDTFGKEHDLWWVNMNQDRRGLDDYGPQYWFFSFLKDADAMAFKLRWI